MDDTFTLTLQYEYIMFLRTCLFDVCKDSLTLTPP